MKGRRVVLAVLVLVAAVLGVWWLTTRSAAEQQVVLGGSGIIEVTEVQVGAQTAGQITSVRVIEGRRVKRGQLLVTIDDRVLKDQVRAAKAGVQAADANLDAAYDAEDDAQIDNAKALIRQAKAQLAIAQAQLTQARVTSPLAGLALDVAVNKGEMASVGQTLITLGDMKRPKLVVYVPEPLIGRVKLGQKATVTVDGLPGRVFDGRISQVAEQAEFTPTSVQTKDQRTKLVYGVTIRLANPGELLKPGMPADAVIQE